MASNPKMNDYQGEDDARTLMRAQEVMSDPKRHGAAKGHLKKLHGERAKESMHAKAAQGLRKAFPDDASAGATKSKNVGEAAKGKKIPPRKSLGKTPVGGSTTTQIQVKKVPTLNTSVPC